MKFQVYSLKTQGPELQWWYHRCDNTPRVVANTEPRNHMPPQGVAPTKALEAGGGRHRGPVHSGQSCILELGNNLINVWMNNQITWVQGNYRLPLSSRQKGAADPVVYSFNHVLDITVCTTSLRKILKIGLGLCVPIFREFHLRHVWHCHNKWILDWISYEYWIGWITVMIIFWTFFQLFSDNVRHCLSKRLTQCHKSTYSITMFQLWHWTNTMSNIVRCT